MNVGVAAHITAAAPGGPRYDESLSQEERSSIENGIWLCQTCAKLVDDDGARYSVELLHEWKRRAEQKALFALEGLTNAKATFVYTEEGPELHGNGTAISPLEWTALFNRYLRLFDESVASGDEPGKANVVATIKAFEETFETTIHEEDVRFLESELGKKADLFFQHMTSLWDQVASRRASESVHTVVATAERRREVVGQLKAFLRELKEAFDESPSGRFESSEQRLLRWKHRLVKFLDANVSSDEAAWCSGIHTALGGGDNSEHHASSLEGHTAYLETLINEIEREPNSPINAEEKESGRPLPRFRSFTYRDRSST